MDTIPSLPSGSTVFAYLVIMAFLIALILGVAFLARLLLRLVIRHILGLKDTNEAGATFLDDVILFLIGGWVACEIVELVFHVDLSGVIGALGIVGVAVSLGAQQTIANVIGGVILSLTKRVNIGDWISIQGGPEGRIIETDWRCTTLEYDDGTHGIVPNAVMVSTAVRKRSPHAEIIVPLALKTTTPNVEQLLLECEQLLLDELVGLGLDWEQKRPKAHLVGTDRKVLQVEVKVYANHTQDKRSIRRAVLPALITFLQERDVLTQ